MLEEQEKQLLEQLQDEKTQRASFALLVNTYSERMYWQVRKIVLTHEDADDVLQNTFIKIWNSIGTFRGDSKLSTWLYRIAINESITFLNKERARNNISLDTDDSFLLAKLESDTYFDGDIAAQKLQAAILTLPPKQRIVFTMKYFDDMKYTEMSAVLDTSVGALKASYHHAVKKIEDFLSLDN